MAQLTDDDVIRRIISGEIPVKDGVPALLDRTTGEFSPPEGDVIDYKLRINMADQNSVGEIARDILGFSNSQGGILVVGANNERRIEGHDRIDLRRLRNAIGVFGGTRVNFELDDVSVNVAGVAKTLLAVVVQRSLSSYPNQLRKDIELRPGLVRKIKYISGTLFYRRGDETLAESPYGDIESRARELGFSGAAPRTRTSFLLQEDKPGLRLYAPINDRFFGREAELAELISKFDDPRGRGVSIAGFGGVGKTELAIRLVSELHRRGKFRTIYSGSAKQTLLGPGGTQTTDPIFIDLPSFLSDLAGWLGFNPGRLTTAQLASDCLTKLARIPKVLLFVDNLETVSDRDLLAFLDNSLPPNCWIVATSRIHKIRSFVYPKELREMEAEDAARLLRHELKRQGLDELASTDIAILREKAKQLYCHPLAIRWFAWACSRNAATWEQGIGDVDIKQLESFCVAHTLGSLDQQTQRVLGAILSITGVADAIADCIRHTSSLPESIVEQSLWELECSGMLYAATDQDGVTTYSVSPLAERPAIELARNSLWEAGYANSLRSYVRKHRDEPPDSPLIRDLLQLEPRRIQEYSPEERNELIARVDRARPRCPDKFAIKLKWLKAECMRHGGSLKSADDLYKDCAESVLKDGEIDSHETDRIRILLEAATVAKFRAPTELQARRVIPYLEAIAHTDVAPLRVLGTLTEMYAITRDRTKYEEYLQKVNSYRESHSDYTDSHVEALEEALERAKSYFDARR